MSVVLYDCINSSLQLYYTTLLRMHAWVHFKHAQTIIILAFWSKSQIKPCDLNKAL